MDLGVDCGICTCKQWLWSTQIQRLSRAFYIKFHNFKGSTVFSRIFQVLQGFSRTSEGRVSTRYHPMGMALKSCLWRHQNANWRI